MNFGEALQALKDGKRVKRAIWGGYWELESDVQLDYYKKEEFQKKNIPQFIVAVLKDGTAAPAQWEEGRKYYTLLEWPAHDYDSSCFVPLQESATEYEEVKFSEIKKETPVPSTN